MNQFAGNISIRNNLKKILIIQTAFIGDVILATSAVETIKNSLPHCEIDFVLRKGNEELLAENPHISRLIIWNKKNGKYRSLIEVIKEIRKVKYDAVINFQRFASSGFMTWRSKSAVKCGYSNNPLSFFFTHKIKHDLKSGKHEIERNLDLLKTVLSDLILQKPKIFTSEKTKEKISALTFSKSYVVMAPSSVWFTKQLPENKWVELIQKQHFNYTVYLIGAPGDKEMLERIKMSSGNNQVENLAGKLSLTESAELIRNARMTYVNDSAPLHLASAMNAPVTAYFCSTVPEFGFGPLSEHSVIVQTDQKLSCRPCGLHGYKQCPKGHFNCGNQISIIP
ncbi:MAG: glycosyltransferase family 9 protein [Crocinitomicaceae bacterium]|nr:glycosyltransferase family 9 protein [Crocinitomicaceae bacterium]